MKHFELNIRMYTWLISIGTKKQTKSIKIGLEKSSSRNQLKTDLKIRLKIILEKLTKNRFRKIDLEKSTFISRYSSLARLRSPSPSSSINNKISSNLLENVLTQRINF